MIPGHATAEGTARFLARHADRSVPDHVRRAGALSLSSVGIGTYLGAADDTRDAGYAAAIARALELGIDVVDTASNYREGRSERVVGHVLKTAARDEIFVASKAGFVRALPPELVDLVTPAEIVGGMHCISPRFLAHQLAQSRDRLGLATIDCYYVHNPETQLGEIDRATFRDRMRAAFATLETAASAGEIRSYGIATWDGLRVPSDAPLHLDLTELVAIARELAGEAHRFRFVQLPINLAMPEAAALPTQRGRTVLDTAGELGLYVMSSASILQGRLAETLAMTRELHGLGTALVGMSDPAHVEANARVFRRQARSNSREID